MTITNMDEYGYASYEVPDRNHTYRWWTATPVNLDALLIFVVRYSRHGDSQYLDQEGKWVDFKPYEVIQPAVAIPGPVLPAHDREADARALTHAVSQNLLAAIAGS